MSNAAGKLIAKLATETLEATQNRIAHDAATGELSKRFALALEIARKRGLPEDRAQDTALAAMFSEQATRMIELELKLLLAMFEKETKVAPRIQIVTEGE